MQSKKRQQAHLIDIFMLSGALWLPDADPLTAIRCQTRWSSTYTTLDLFTAAARRRKTETLLSPGLWCKNSKQSVNITYLLTSQDLSGGNTSRVWTLTHWWYFIFPLYVAVLCVFMCLCVQTSSDRVQQPVKHNNNNTNNKELHLPGSFLENWKRSSFT